MPDEEEIGAAGKQTNDTEIKPDISAYEAKIVELTGIIAERDLVIADLTGQVTATKAANYDLLMAAPMTGDVVTDDASNKDETPDETDVDFSDLFGKDKD